MAVGALFFSLMGLLVKLAGARIPAQEIVLIRASMNLLFTYVLVRRGGVSLWGHNRPLLVLRGLAGFVGLSCLFYSLPRLPLAEGIVLMNSYPVFTAIAAYPILGEALGRPEWAALLISMVGVLVMVRPSFLFGGAEAALSPIPVAVALTGAVAAGIAYVLVRKLRATEHPLTVVFYFPLVSAPASLPWVIAHGVWPTAIEWLWLLGIGITSQVAQVAVTQGLHRERAGRATAVTYLQFVFALLWGWLFLSEFPDAWRLFGALLIIGGVLLLPLSRRKTGDPG